jgi:hypothetical protein
MYFRDMTNERVAKELQRVADLAAQRQRETDEAKRNGTYKPTNAQHQQQQ